MGNACEQPDRPRRGSARASRPRRGARRSALRGRRPPGQLGRWRERAGADPRARSAPGLRCAQRLHAHAAPSAVSASHRQAEKGSGRDMGCCEVSVGDWNPSSPQHPGGRCAVGSPPEGRVPQSRHRSQGLPLQVTPLLRRPSGLRPLIHQLDSSSLSDNLGSCRRGRQLLSPLLSSP
jgi:hypothetical protein